MWFIVLRILTIVRANVYYIKPPPLYVTGQFSVPLNHTLRIKITYWKCKSTNILDVQH